jgi:hypothetical protein
MFHDGFKSNDLRLSIVRQPDSSRWKIGESANWVGMVWFPPSHALSLAVTGSDSSGPRHQNEVILLWIMEGFSHEEVACRFDRRVGAFRTLWVRALTWLRKEMKAIESE